MKTLNGIVLCLFEILVGILLLIDPVGFTSGVIIAAGAGLVIFGLMSVIKYFRSEAEEAAIGQCLSKGLAALLAGGFCIFRSQWFAVTFPVLTVLYGIVILLTGLGKVQMAVDMLRFHIPKWFITAISAAVSIICAIVVIQNPFASTSVLWVFTGITLIVEAVLDMVSLLVSGNRKKEEKEG